ncbi:hypothetical protein ACOME3_006778 [Neoechinorhynchus agilis]
MRIQGALATLPQEIFCFRNAVALNLFVKLREVLINIALILSIFKIDSILTMKVTAKSHKSGDLNIKLVLPAAATTFLIFKVKIELYDWIIKNAELISYLILALNYL